MVIKEVEKPVTTPAIISHLQYLAPPLLENEDCNIFMDLTL